MLGRLFVPVVSLTAAFIFGQLTSRTPAPVPDAPKPAPVPDRAEVDRNAAAIDAALTRVVERLHERVTALERKP